MEIPLEEIRARPSSDIKEKRTHQWDLAMGLPSSLKCKARDLLLVELRSSWDVLHRQHLFDSRCWLHKDEVSQPRKVKQFQTYCLWSWKARFQSFQEDQNYRSLQTRNLEAQAVGREEDAKRADHKTSKAEIQKINESKLNEYLCKEMRCQKQFQVLPIQQ